ncbi:MAG: hypothetical protein JST12_18210 [Armatimonadetes bacterium]|nr:hypothetical protein [Armatimonadota bacterium]
MSWIKVVLEVSCHIGDGDEVPVWCKYGPGNPNVHCMMGDSGGSEPCQFVAWGTSPASLVLTDKDGESVAETGFDGDAELPDGEFARQEREWIDSKRKVFERSS